MKLSDAQLAKNIAADLTDYQAMLVTIKETHTDENQSIIPTVTLGYDEIRKLTHRTKIRASLVKKLVGLLEDEGLEVECEDAALIISKPAEDMPTEFGSWRELSNMLKELRPE